MNSGYLLDVTLGHLPLPLFPRFLSLALIGVLFLSVCMSLDFFNAVLSGEFSLVQKIFYAVPQNELEKHPLNENTSLLYHE